MANEKTKSGRDRDVPSRVGDYKIRAMPDGRFRVDRDGEDVREFDRVEDAKGYVHGNAIQRAMLNLRQAEREYRLALEDVFTLTLPDEEEPRPRTPAERTARMIRNAGG